MLRLEAGGRYMYRDSELFLYVMGQLLWRDWRCILQLSPADLFYSIAFSPLSFQLCSNLILCCVFCSSSSCVLGYVLLSCSPAQSALGGPWRPNFGRVGVPFRLSVCCSVEGSPATVCALVLLACYCLRAFHGSQGWSQ